MLRSRKGHNENLYNNSGITVGKSAFINDENTNIYIFHIEMKFKPPKPISALAMTLNLSRRFATFKNA